MNPFATIIAITTTLLLTACSTPQFDSNPNNAFADQGLDSVSGSGFRKAYARPGSNLADYSAVELLPLQLEEVEITRTLVPGTNAGDWQMTPERAQVMAGAWQQALEQAFANYQIVDANSTGALQIAARLVKVDPRPGSTSNSNTSAASSEVAGASGSVNIAMEIRLFDTTDNKLLAVIQDDKDIITLEWARGNGINMRNLFNLWAALLHSRVNTNKPD